jgi:hypothetical protein
MAQVSRQIKSSSARSIFIISPRYIDLKTGRRSDTAHGYIYNQDHNTNLKILVRHRVVRVIFEYVSIFRCIQKYPDILNLGVLVRWELNMSTILLEEQRVLLCQLWLGRHVLLFFLLGHLERRLSLRDPVLVQRMS